MVYSPRTLDDAIHCQLLSLPTTKARGWVSRCARSSRISMNTLPQSELIVVDDGSTDDTADAAREELAESGAVRTSVISYQSNLGKGRAVRLGLLASRGDIALFTDADLSTPITETPKLVDPIARGECDLAFGSRALDRSLIGVHQPWRREQGGRVLIWRCGWRPAFPSGTRSVASKRFA